MEGHLERFWTLTTRLCEVQGTYKALQLALYLVDSDPASGDGPGKAGLLVRNAGPAAIRATSGHTLHGGAGRLFSVQHLFDLIHIHAHHR